MEISMIQIDKDVVLNDISNVVNDKCPSFSGIVSQECKGNLWVNDIETPTIAIAESYAVGGFAFLGTYKSKDDFIVLKQFLDIELLPLIKDKGCYFFEFSIESESIRDNILELFQDKNLQTEREFSFRINAIPILDKDIPMEYQIHKVDAMFWKRLSDGIFDNANFLRDRLLGSWHSFEEFEHKSIAYCTIFDNRIVAVIVGTANYKNIIPIDIETEEEHRRKGLAYAMTAEFIADCLNNDYIPQWDCVESNPSSHHIAIKLGFEKLNENTVYWFDI
jgi:RimJ/RimL family protein N-acetyltransferase